MNQVLQNQKENILFFDKCYQNHIYVRVKKIFFYLKILHNIIENNTYPLIK